MADATEFTATAVTANNAEDAKTWTITFQTDRGPVWVHMTPRVLLQLAADIPADMYATAKGTRE